MLRLNVFENVVQIIIKYTDLCFLFITHCRGSSGDISWCGWLVTWGPPASVDPVAAAAVSCHSALPNQSYFWQARNGGQLLRIFSAIKMSEFPFYMLYSVGPHWIAVSTGCSSCSMSVSGFGICSPIITTVWRKQLQWGHHPCHHTTCPASQTEETENLPCSSITDRHPTYGNGLSSEKYWVCLKVTFWNYKQCFWCPRYCSPECLLLPLTQMRSWSWDFQHIL